MGKDQVSGYFKGWDEQTELYSTRSGSHWRSGSGENHDLTSRLQGHLWRIHHREVEKEAMEASC